MISLIYFLFITYSAFSFYGTTKNTVLDMLFGAATGAVLTTIMLGTIFLFTKYLP